MIAMIAMIAALLVCTAGTVLFGAKFWPFIAGRRVRSPAMVVDHAEQRQGASVRDQLYATVFEFTHDGRRLRVIDDRWSAEPQFALRTSVDVVYPEGRPELAIPHDRAPWRTVLVATFAIASLMLMVRIAIAAM